MPTKLLFASALASRAQPRASAQCSVLSGLHASACTRSVHVQYSLLAKIFC
ncbi:hypothetical protein PF005_g30899 [Phytophthora fragariae]|uniref:Uncharacterized protein n=1 Tax=Phytophthora fragariae TaxID=53985 RepID=A0A6A3DKJ6_9STRA|nr:hypothetical protein PF003_g14886 [Phytophthora fragariae]KAE8918628.1 hypothetical protein PF009_g31059 [Phytophthora fragariae]KAE8960560.1 hypothetical protein PF011_g30050 [Phytophthora fragariae]KAE9059751.1 hypothetical protein PF010_g30498 [Phytophthora fragariae]KAE9060408.1 hypothetical protein PF007_g30623 [Phytophthora fragariae]